MAIPGAGRAKLLPHGGHRNRADRTSDCLTEKQCSDLFEASSRAWALDRPLNRFGTIHWEKSGISDANAAKATGHFIKLASDWMRERGHPFIWAWVRENDAANIGPGKRRKGSHVHILWHVPPELDPLFRVMPLRWVKRIIPGKCKAGTLVTQRIRYADAIGLMPDAYEAALMGKVAYMLKAAPVDIGNKFGLPRMGESGRIIGKRVAIWQGWRGKPAGRHIEKS